MQPLALALAEFLIPLKFFSSPNYPCARNTK